MRKTQLTILTLICTALAALFLVPVDASAYEQYTQDGGNDPTNCGACHGDFRANSYFSLSDGSFWIDGLHNTHRNGMLDGDCNTCHSPGPRFPVILDSSTGGDGLDPVSCVGCHGRAEDDSVANGGACTIGDCGPGTGLRQHHFNAGETICLDCHDNADPANYTPVGEDLPPPYYFSPDANHPNKPTDPCNDDFVGGPTGLDNDGDGDYDGADANCGVLPVEDCFDGADNDGDGDIDCADIDCDGAVGAPTTCGVGECSGNTGNLECQGGVEVNTCDPLAGAAADDSVCDGLDNDCDGPIDEDYAVTPTTCGVGECSGNTGSLTCEGGAEVDSCDPLAGALPDDQCDGLDNDCDGVEDDDYAATPTTCGVGECAGNTGNLECQGGAEVDTCDPLAGALPDDQCDGLDNDCDGPIDDDYVVTPTTCGVGECSGNTGSLTCEGGAEVDSCDPLAGALPDDQCDGLDNDCDGVEDDDYAATPTTCGVGECAGNTGSLECQGGAEVDTCDPLTGALPDDQCDGLDNDCDGPIDDDYVVTSTTCGLGECSGNTGSLTCEAGVEVDSCDPLAGALPDDQCDGLDNDCDGVEDDDYAVTPTTCGLGECSGNTGSLTCEGGAEVDSCDPLAGALPDDQCDGLDNDCDGPIDDDYAVTPTTCGVGECSGNTGSLTCEGGAEVDSCDPLAGALPDDQCDGLDNDCDGPIDDDYAVTPTTCGVGECSGNTGNLECQGGAEVDTCDPFAGAVAEVCDDALDNDCDGLTDINDPECQAAEDCFDGADNDGDGDIDCADADCDGAVGAPTTCGVGECSGNTGNLECQGGAEVNTCDPFAGAAADDSVCDGLDNDCDGPIDEDYVVTPTTCGLGECSGNTGSLTCEAGVEVDSCDPLAGALPDDQCDGLDNDCDGAEDDDYAVTPTTCGVGECAGNTGNLECQGGAEVDTCDPFAGALPDNQCDGLDNDCDGPIDDDYVVTPTTCGVGECSGNTGTLTCEGGAEVDSCDPLAGALPDDQCDGLDNDCDGAEDDDYAVTPTTCGVGECSGNTGNLECQGGAEVDTCDPFAGAVAEVCDDALDNDCDGLTDIDDPECQAAEDCFDGADNDGDGDIDCADADCDGAVGAPTTCGVGECSGNTGNLECQGGAEVNTCDPFAGAAADDSVCDGLDNDCDGPIDEDYVVTPTTCGLGECSGNTGSLTCEAGVEVDSCDPLAGALPDDQCDGLDNDCDGAIDDDYAVTPTTCGVGECSGNTGNLECQDGAEIDTCDPFAGAAADDSVCDGLDNDCDGAVDEDYAVTPTTCGLGECSGNTGNLECQGGAEVDTCDPFAGAMPEVCDDTLDNDCDGLADGDDPECVVPEVDLDIVRFQASKRVGLSGKGKKGPKPVEIKFVIKNDGAVDEPRPATIVGLLSDGSSVTVFSQNVSDLVGDGRTTYTATYMPSSTGDIVWTATIFDDDADMDVATRVTTVVP